MRVFQAFGALFYVHGMFFRDDADAGSDEDIIPDGDFAAVHQPAVHVQEEIISHRGVISVGAKERLLHGAVFSGLPEDIADRGLSCLTVKRMHVVVLIQLSYRFVPIGGKFRIPDVMEQSGAVLVEVGTTNKTHYQDYVDAITEETKGIKLTLNSAVNGEVEVAFDFMQVDHSQSKLTSDMDFSRMQLK